jgi:hypothetical protein
VKYFGKCTAISSVTDEVSEWLSCVMWTTPGITCGGLTPVALQSLAQTSRPNTRADPQPYLTYCATGRQTCAREQPLRLKSPKKKERDWYVTGCTAISSVEELFTELVQETRPGDIEC